VKIYHTVFNQTWNKPELLNGRYDGVAIYMNNVNSIMTIDDILVENMSLSGSNAIRADAGKNLDIVNSNFRNINNTGNGSAVECNIELRIRQCNVSLCRSDLNGGAFYLKKDCSFQLLDLEFSKCHAFISGGSIFITAPASKPEVRYLARIRFLDNTADNMYYAGNDIRDENALSIDWSFGTAVNLCSTSKSVRLSCGEIKNLQVSKEFEKYIPLCFNNPCLDYVIKKGEKCPADCEEVVDENMGEGYCVAGNCTRLHYEDKCYSNCTKIWQDGVETCVHDPCVGISKKDECHAECEWIEVVENNAIKGLCKVFFVGLLLCDIFII
jgi:hypothetical protein